MANANDLSARHPSYEAFAEDWLLMRDSYLGERRIKVQGTRYLPYTRTMEIDNASIPGSRGARNYAAYKLRAVYHELVLPALTAALGVMHCKPPKIVVPKRMEEMLKRFSFDGEDVYCLLQRVNEQQLLMGRVGLLLDIPSDAPPDALPYVVTYSAESLLNWDTTRAYAETGPRTTQFVVLNESAKERVAGLTWVDVNRYRVIAQAEQVQDVWPDLQIPAGYITGSVSKRENIGGQEFILPELGGRSLEVVPFEFCGPRDLTPEPDIPPLLALARIALAIYRGEADHREALHMQTEETLVVKGLSDDEDKAIKVGASSSIKLPAGSDYDAKYIGPSGAGLSAMNESIENDKRMAEHLGGSLLTERGGDAESADALNIRKSSKTATLTSVAQTGCAAVEKMLKYAATWMGMDPEEVEVTPNIDFGDPDAVAKDLVDLMTAKMLGAPISTRSVHGWMVQKDFTQKTFEEEQEEMAEDPPTVAAAPAGPGVPGANPFGRPKAAPAAQPQQRGPGYGQQ